MLSSSKIQNGGWIQDGGEKVFFHFKISKMIIFPKNFFCCVFGLKIQLLCNFFFSKNSEWRINQNGEIFWDALIFLWKIFTSTFFIEFSLQNNKTDVAKHETSKWRPNSRWTPKRFYRLKLLYMIFYQFFF
jgi:hypothetical protein